MRVGVLQAAGHRLLHQPEDSRQAVRHLVRA
jgi:hypothetical protein